MIALDVARRSGTRGRRVQLFYFAGHGVQRNKDDVVLLLEEFGNGLGGPLVHAVDVKNIFYGMAPAPTRPQIAYTQLYFVDACRNMPSAFAGFRDTADYPGDRRGPRGSGPLASIAGTTALGLRGKQTLFSKALINCFVNDAADLVEVNGQDRWVVSVQRPAQALDLEISDLNQELGGDQDWGFEGVPKRRGDLQPAQGS